VLFSAPTKCCFEWDDGKSMTDAERRLLVVLAFMSEQYLSKDGALRHSFMSAGEEAIELLVEYGLVSPEPGGGRWNDAGRDLLNSPAKL